MYWRSSTNPIYLEADLGGEAASKINSAKRGLHYSTLTSASTNFYQAVIKIMDIYTRISVYTYVYM